MSSNNTSVPARPGGLSLYANLLDPSNASTPGSISKAPVIFKNPAPEPVEEESTTTKKPQIDAATLRFQPTKRPQLSQQKPKPKSTFPRPAAPQRSTSVTASKQTENAKPAVKNTLADWTNAEEDVFYEREKAQRGGRKKRKKNRDEQMQVQDWDDIYDPTRPNSYEEYKHSDEKIREVREWKDRLYAHRMARKTSEKDSDSEEDFKPVMGNQFAPLSIYSFAPPPMDSAPPPPLPPDVKDDSDAYSPAGASPQLPSQTTLKTETTTISRAPVRYTLPEAPADIPTSEAELEKALADEDADETLKSDEPRSLRPGQKGFAQRLMSKYGWSKGSGLGAEGTGITTALRMQVEKQKKKEGETALGPRGKIVGGKRNEGTDEKGKFGAMSSVIVLRGMVDGMDLDEEVEGSGGLMQEIGEECGEKYGRVERVFIDRANEMAPKVFVKFTQELSALRAVNALEGRIFNGNTIKALFYDLDAFEKGNYNN